LSSDVVTTNATRVNGLYCLVPSPVVADDIIKCSFI